MTPVRSRALHTRAKGLMHRRHPHGAARCRPAGDLGCEDTMFGDDVMGRLADGRSPWCAQPRRLNRRTVEGSRRAPPCSRTVDLYAWRPTIGACRCADRCAVAASRATRFCRGVLYGLSKRGSVARRHICRSRALAFCTGSFLAARARSGQSVRRSAPPTRRKASASGCQR
jgi:hypothetical protein